MNLKTNFTKGEENAQDGLNDNFAKIDPMISDTGWINLEYKPGYNFDSRFMPKYRKIGNRVFFQGQLEGGAANGVFAVMPEEFRPSYIAHTDVAAVSGNATEKGRVYVDSTSGEVSLVAQSGSKGYWLDELTYLID